MLSYRVALCATAQMTKEARNIKAPIRASGLSDFGFSVSFGLASRKRDVRHSSFQDLTHL